MPIVKELDGSAAPVVAAFDLGSNSIKMTVGRPAAGGGADEFLWRSVTVRLGAGIEATGRIADDRIEAAIATLRGFAAEAREAGAVRSIGVATEATRVATNGAAFLARVQAETGIEIQAISGDREAELTFRGIAASLDLDGDVVIADIGGGSTEVILALDGDYRWGRSISLGSGRLTDRLVVADPPTRDELAACRAEAAAAFAELPLPAGPIDRLVVVGGTGEYLFQLLPGVDLIAGAEIEALVERLTTISAAALTAVITIPEARARVLPAGAAIVSAFARRLAPRAIQGARSGIRTGLLLAAFAGEI